MSNQLLNGAVAIVVTVGGTYTGWNQFLSPVFGMKAITLIQAIYAVFLLAAFWMPYVYMKAHRIFRGEPGIVYCRRERQDEWGRWRSD